MTRRHLVLAAAVLLGGCGSSSQSPKNDAGSDASLGPLGFIPSNIDLTKLDLSNVVDEDITGPCELRTVADGSENCFMRAANGTVTQSDGSTLHVIVVKSLRVEPAGRIRLSTIGGALPMAIVSLGDFTLLGTIEGAASGLNAGPGGFSAGGGPGGGAAATGVTLTPGASAGGASYCGLGGQGVLEMGATGAAGAKTAAYGTPALVPLVGGSAGGLGDIASGGGGGAVQLVSGGTFTLGTGASVNVGGGGGPSGGTTGQEAGGGGSGGAILIEAKTITIAGTLAANGGGGGGGGGIGAGDGASGAAGATPAAGGTGSAVGGLGGAGTTVDGTTPAAPTTGGGAPAGGGGVGRIRLNSRSGQATLTGATLSPAATTPCVTQGMI
jgi:hypothetical protein